MAEDTPQPSTYTGPSTSSYVPQQHSPHVQDVVLSTLVTTTIPIALQVNVHPRPTRKKIPGRQLAPSLTPFPSTTSLPHRRSSKAPNRRTAVATITVATSSHPTSVGISVLEESETLAIDDF
ncbi:hypothetical protein L6452_43803 [Arctium lappa]|uniref:Uncharacterized protein n=1 Tax=Arctium lappa TaxID=4217 RepID=A0ACB8XDW0_ARCLA|nr:hypothetical protein L6452_43803 [Arctium lappa]